MKIVLHDREDDLDDAPLATPRRERWIHPFASITEEPLRSPPALVQRVRTGGGSPDPLLVARIEAVHRVLARCGVPHVLPLRAVERDDEGGIVLVHREVLGEDLGTMLARGPISLERTFSVLRQLCRAIGRAHAVGVEHRLLGPASVILGGHGAGLVEIMDFGLADLVDDDVVAENAVELWPFTPERVLGGGTATSEDVYAIGSLALFMMSGRPPFRGSDLPTLRRRHAIEDCPSLADVAAYPVPPALVEAIDDALHKDPDDRPCDIAELEAAIVRAQREAGVETPCDAVLDAPSRRRADALAPTEGSPRSRRRRTAPLSIDPAMVDSGRGAAGVAAREMSSEVPKRRGGTLVTFADQAPRRSGGRILATMLGALAFGVGAWAIAGSTSSAEAPIAVQAAPEPDAPSVYAPQPVAPMAAASAIAAAPIDVAMDPSALGLAAAPTLDASAPDDDALDERPNEDELDAAADAELEAELASIVIEDDPGESPTAEPEAAPKAATEGPARPSEGACASQRRTAYAARNAHRWAALLRATRNAECWAAPRERAKLRVKALMELQRFEGCAKLGAALSQPDPELSRWVALCRERAKASAKTSAKAAPAKGTTGDRYAAASTQQ